MPALPPVPGVFRIEFGWQVGSDLSVGTRFFQAYSGPPPTLAAMGTFATQVHGSGVSHFPAVMHSSILFLTATCTDLSSSTGAVGQSGGSTPGTRTGIPLDAGTCLLLNGGIARRYRGGKPRYYLPWGVAGDLATNQTWTSAFTSAAQAAWQAMLNDIGVTPPAGTTITQSANVSYYHGFASVQNPVTKRWRNIPTPRDVPLVDLFNRLSVNPRPGSQRRRIAA